MNLRLLQLGDSALPIGGYSHSWGLEAGIDRGMVRDAGSLETWVRHWLQHSIGPLDGVVVACVHHAAAIQDWQAVANANDLLWASQAVPSLRQAGKDMGEQLLGLAESWDWAWESVAGLRAVSGSGTAWQHPCVFATLTAAAGAAPADAVAVFLHQAAVGVISAGVRAIPIGHTHGQQVLSRLQDDIGTLAGELCDRPLESAGSFTPAYEAFCHAQTGLYTRLFRS